MCAVRVNEYRQRAIEARKALDVMMDEHAAARAAYSDLLGRQAEGRLSADDPKILAAAEKVAGFDSRLSAERKRVTAAEEVVAAEEERLRIEDAELARKPSGRIPRPAGEETVRSTGRIGAKYADLFGHPASVQAQGWQSGGQFFDVVTKGLYHPSLVPMAAFMNEGTGSDGGYLAPEETVARVFDGAVEDEEILRRVTIEPMATDTKRVAGFATKDHSTAGPFGFAGGWVAEGATLTPEKALVKVVKLVAKKLALLVQASSEIVADGLDFEGQLEGAMRRALGWLLADAVWNGTGSGQPLGLLNSPAKVVVAKETSQTADTVVYNNVVNMLARLLPSSMGRAVFFASHTCRPELMKLSVPIGVAGTWIPLVLGADGIYRLLGIPLYWTEHLPVIGDQGDLVLCDPSQYALGMRRQVSLDRSAHVGFSSDLMTYRGIVRADGQLVHDAPFTPKNGSTQAPVVVLAVR